MSKTLTGLPREHGFRMPGEFEPHQGCWMLWPENTETFRLGAKPAQQAYAEAACAIAGFEPVTMGVSREQYNNARSRLPDHIRVVEMSSNDAWMRDVGPTFIVNEEDCVRGVDWRFNAWGGLSGGLYFPWDLDEAVARKVLEIEGVERYRAPLILEGGSIHVDGEGTLLTTRQCLLNPNRNPEMNQAEIETHLKDYLNIEKIIWLDRGVYMDETDGHIDDLCCFARPGEVLLHWTDDKGDPQYEISQSACEVLSTTRDARGRALKIHKLHQPEPLTLTMEEEEGVDLSENAYPRKAGSRLAASYVNFYIANQGIVAPVFDDPMDRHALDTLESVFPGREVVGVLGREILLGGGNIHCITQQQPLAGC